MSEEPNQIDILKGRLMALEDGLERINDFLDRNNDGLLNSADDKIILRDSLKATQGQISQMQHDFNLQQENTQKRSLYDKIVTGLILVGTFLLSVFL